MPGVAVPDDKTRAGDVGADPDISAALHALFGREAPDEVEPLTGGRSGATLLKLVVDGRRYVLRKVPQASMSLDDPQRELACMKTAAELGVAPPLHYCDAGTGVCIMDFIDAQPIGPYLRDGDAGLVQLAGLFRKLHEGPAFPPVMPVAEIVQQAHRGLAGSGAASPWSPAFVEAAAEIHSALAGHIHPASCHLDPNPSNILFDGERLWLVDWGLAGLGDPFMDLAGIGIFAASLGERRRALVSAYLGSAPLPRDEAHLYLARALALMLYAAAFRGLGARRGFAPEAMSAESPPDLATVLMRIQAPSAAILDDPSFVAVIEHEARRASSGDAYERALDVLR